MRFLVLLLSLISSSYSAFAAEFGSILIHENGKSRIVTLEIHATLKGELQNKFLNFVNAPDLKKDANNCYCYPSDDIRFAYVQAYYHISKQLEFFSPELEALKVTINEPLKVKLSQVSGQQTWGMITEENVLELEFPTPDFDYSLLAHEVSHAIHNLLGAPTSITVTGNETWFYEQGVSEGTANILAALYLNSPIISEFSPLTNSVDIFVSEPDMVYTNRKQYEVALSNQKFWEFFPEMAEKLKAYFLELQTSVDSHELEIPSPYFHSNIVNQPLWLASQVFGREKVVTLYLKVISNTTPVKSYSDFAQRILNVAKPQNDLSKFLVQEFSKRGLKVFI